MAIRVNTQIHLSEFRATDRDACLAHFREKEIYDRTLRIPFPYTESHFAEWLEIVAESTRRQGRAVHWAIRDHQEDLIGGIGLENFELGKSHRAEIGYWLAKPYWGRGIMTAIVARVCALAFEEFGLVKITAHVFADNAASIRVLEKLGFVQEGYLRKHYLKDGRYFDSRVFALIQDVPGGPAH